MIDVTEKSTRVEMATRFSGQDAGYCLFITYLSPCVWRMQIFRTFTKFLWFRLLFLYVDSALKVFLCKEALYCRCFSIKHLMLGSMIYSNVNFCILKLKAAGKVLCSQMELLRQFVRIKRNHYSMPWVAEMSLSCFRTTLFPIKLSMWHVRTKRERRLTTRSST